MGLFFWVTVAMLSVPLRVFGWLWEKWHFGASQTILREKRLLFQNGLIFLNRQYYLRGIKDNKSNV